MSKELQTRELTAVLQDVASFTDKPGLSCLCADAAAEIQMLRVAVRALRESLILHHGMMVTNQPPTAESEQSIADALTLSGS